MLEDLLYEWSDFVLLVLILGVVPSVLLYVAMSQIRESRGVLSDEQRLAVGINFLVAVGAPVVALLLDDLQKAWFSGGHTLSSPTFSGVPKQKNLTGSTTLCDSR